ncbi:30S ribosomal protein S8e [Candidatus Woesearchaeota archaeon]|nr:30S ribosomal protein S8e [Candidatus Woesearchaeota archaeon]
MVITQNRSKRKATGGRFAKLYRSKRKFEVGRVPAMTTIGERFLKIIRTKGGDTKQKLHKTQSANVFDSKSKKYAVTKVKTVVDNPANRNFVRRNVMTKGTLIDTDLGKARITSRPGQDGVVNAVLV